MNSSAAASPMLVCESGDTRDDRLQMLELVFRRLQRKGPSDRNGEHDHALVRLLQRASDDALDAALRRE
jgi:hypothetical protein